MYWTFLQLLLGILKCWLSSAADFRMLIISFCCSTPSLITNGESFSLSLHDTSRTEHFFTLEWLMHLKTLLLMDLKVFKNLEWTGSTVVRQTGMAGFKCHAKTRKEFCFLTLLRLCMKWERKAQISLFFDWEWEYDPVLLSHRKWLKHRDKGILDWTSSSEVTPPFLST